MKRLAVIASCLLGGCTLVGGGAPVEVREYDLLPDGPAAVASAVAPSADPTPWLQLEPFDADPLLASEGLVWRRGAAEVGSYAGHRWARRPEDGLREALARALAAAGPGVVVTDPPCEVPAWVLHARLARCEEVVRGERWAGALELRMSLVRERDGATLLRATYVAEEPAATRNPPGVVEALQRAAARVAREAVRDVGLALEGELAPGR